MPDSCTSAMMYNRPAALIMLAAWDPHSRTQIRGGDPDKHKDLIPGGLHNKRNALFDWEMQSLLRNGAVQWAARGWVDVSAESLKNTTMTFG